MKRITVPWLSANYSKREVMVPMRDGAGLYTAIYSPRDESSARPVLLLRTPFPLKPYGRDRFSNSLRGALSIYAEAGYIIVQQNVRGTYLSEGSFVNVRPVKSAEYSGNLIDTSELTDTYDTAEWLLHNTRCDGSIGVKGVSYPGFYAVCAAMCGHPAIKAVSPQAPVTDWFMGDDIHHNGAFMLNDIYHFGKFFFRKRPHPGSRILPTRHEGHKDIYRFFLKKGHLPQIMGGLVKKNTFWRDIAAHPDYDSFWQDRNNAEPLGQYAKESPLPAMLVVGGTFDAEDLHGPLECFGKIASLDNSFLVLGPWSHGAWGRKNFDHLSGAALGAGLSRYYLKNIELPFFEYFLEGKGDRPAGKVRIFPSSAEPYNGKPSRYRRKHPWAVKMEITSGSWPLQGGSKQRLYLDCTRRLREQPPTSLTSASYISNPLKPVPACPRSPYLDGQYMAADQRFASRRKDVLSFRGDKVKETVVIAGPVKVSINLAISSDDADIVVKLIDVRPDGYQMLLRGDIMPLRFRNSFTDPEPIQPGQPVKVEFTMKDIAHVLQPGHRLMVQVQSSWFPLFAVNPQKFVSNPYREQASAQTAEITILSGPDNPSFIEITQI